MNFILGVVVAVLGIAAGVLYQANGKLQQGADEQTRKVADLSQTIDDQKAAVAMSDELKARLAAAHADADRARAEAGALQTQAKDLTSQLAAKHQEITQDHIQIEQLSATSAQELSELNDLRTKYAAASAQQQLQLQQQQLQSSQPITPTIAATPVNGITYGARTYYYGGYWNGWDYNSLDSALIQAKTAEANAQSVLQSAGARVNSITADSKAQFEQTAEYGQAKVSLDAAQTTYNSAQRDATSTLHSSAEYTAAVEAMKASAQAVSDAREQGNSSDVVATLAQHSLESKSAVTNLEGTALTGNAEYQASKATLATAKSAVSQLDQQFQSIIASNRNYQQAKADFGVAKSNYDSAVANLAALQKAKDDHDAAQFQNQSRQNMQNWANQHQYNGQSGSSTHH